jgi:polar amino acid transport system substrate-binding protein
MQPLLKKSLIKYLAMFCIAFAGSFPVFALELNQLTFITENSASYNYVRNGKLQGPAVELLLAASADAGSPVMRDAILVLPWARAYRNAQERPNTVLFSTIRTPQREENFQWVGPIAAESDVLVALKSRDIELNNQEQIKNYLTGAVEGDVGEEILRGLRIPEQKIALVSNSKSLGKMLDVGRIDLWIFGEDGWQETLISSGIDPDKFEVIYRFPPKHYYFALSQDIEQKLVNKFQKAIDVVLKSKNLTF